MDPYESFVDLYDLEHAEFADDIPFFSNLLPDGAVLDVGTGSGRLLKPLAASSRTVWGVDPSHAMLEQARARVAGLENVHLKQSSILDLDLPERFAGIVLSLNVLWHLDDMNDQVRALERCAQHLQLDGLLLIDLSNPLTMLDRGAQGEIRQRFDAMLGSDHVRGMSSAWDDPAMQQLHLSLWYDRMTPDGQVRRRQGDLTLRYTYRWELELALRQANLLPLHFYGSYELEPYSTDSPNLIVAATPR